MTKKELEAKIEELEDRLIIKDGEIEAHIRSLTTNYSKYRVAKKTIGNIITVAWKFADGDAQDGIDVIKMLADNAWMGLEKWDD